MRSKLLFLIFVLIVTLAALPGSISADNLVFNPGFEDLNADNTPWDEDLYPDEWNGYAEAGSRAWIETGGVRGAGLDLTAAEVAAQGMMAWPAGTGATSDIPIDTAEEYYFAVSAKGGPSLQLKIEWHATDGETGEGGLTIVTQDFSTTSDWKQFQVGPLTPDPAAYFVRFVMHNLISGTTITIDDAWVGTSPPGVHSPNPQDDGTVVPGTDTVAWTRNKGKQGDDLLCTLYWNGGASDVNDVNFDVKVPSPVATFVNQDANSVYLPDHGLSVVIDKNYYWRVDAEDPNGNNWGVETLVGPIWMFTTINAPPVVEAGTKQAKWLDDPCTPSPEVFQLAGAVTDDILPVGGSLDPYWEKLSGSGTAVFSDPCILDPTVTIDTADDYELKLTVNDGALDGDDTVVIRVHANAFTGLLARYDCEETNLTWGIHDDYSGVVRNPTGAYPDFDYSNGTRRGERMNAIGLPNSAEMGKDATTLLEDGGHNGAIYAGDFDPTAGDGGIQFDGEAGHVYLANSDSDPNFNSWHPYAKPEDDPCWTASWADQRDEVSVMAWIKVDPDTGWDNNNEAIITKGYDSALFGAYRLERNASDDGILFTCDGVTPSQAGGSLPVNDEDPNGDPRWHHVAGTYDGAEICVYVDGVIDSCVPTDGERINLSDAPLVLGELYAYDAESGDDPFQPFGGVMDEIRIHSIGVPHRSSQGDEDDADATISIVKIYRDSGGHVSCGTTYVAGDVNHDCYVTIEDVQEMVLEWLECNDIAEPYCDQFGYNQ